MPAKIFYPSAEKLKYMLDGIHNRDVALPDFQRDFVWEPRATEELIESICQNYPAGSLLRIKNSNGFYFAPREFAGAPILNGKQPSYLILDGQQRLTSLYQAFYGIGGYRYFINFQCLMDGSDLEDCIFYLNLKDTQKKYATLEQQAEALVFPFRLIFGDSGGFDEWLDQVLEHRSETGTEEKTLKQQLRGLKKTWLDPVEEYEFPVVTLADDTSAAAVCTIFETLNRTGVKLSVFDLLTARFWSDDVRLRDLWAKAQEDYPIISEFWVDPYYILQAIALYTASSAPSCKRSDVLKMTISQINTGWQPVVEGLVKFLYMLRNECGVILPQWLPYNTILVPAAAMLAAHARVTGPAEAAMKNKLKQWFWCSVFGQAYENAPNSQSVRDYAAFKSWVAGGEAPQFVANFNFDFNSLRQTTPRQRAVYRGAIALILRNGACDFHNGGKITAQQMLQDKIEDHHVFPQAYLFEKRPDVNGVLRDCILNRTLIDKSTNASIGRKEPQVYLSEILGQVGDNYLNHLLNSHLLPQSLTCADYTSFEVYLDERQHLLAAEIQNVTQPDGSLMSAQTQTIN
jgi:hypothetical protein